MFVDRKAQMSHYCHVR